MNLNEVLVKPVVTEKSNELTNENKYVFKVRPDANKIMVKDAVKKIFGVDPVRVNIQVNRGKSKRNRYKVGVSSSWKKAIVTLKLGDKIELYEK